MEISSSIFFCKRRLVCIASFKPNQRHLLPVRCYDSKSHDWGWMLGCWRSEGFRYIIPKRYDPIILFVEYRIKGESFRNGKNDDSIPVIHQVIQLAGASLQTLLNHCCKHQEFPETSQTFPFTFFDHPGQSGDWNFHLLCQSLSFSGIGRFRRHLWWLFGL